MTIPNIMEIDGEAEVGRYYMVPTVDAEWHSFKRPWAVLLPKHTDKEIIGFPAEHYHLDLRFFPTDRWRHADRWHHRTPETLIAGTPLHGERIEGWREDAVHAPIDAPVVWRRQLCKRKMPIVRWPYAERPIPHWRGALEEAYKGDRLRPGLICPHKGVCLKGQPVRDGVVECPAHGLRWNVETGALVPTKIVGGAA